jgi:hypothetical protein
METPTMSESNSPQRPALPKSKASKAPDRKWRFGQAAHLPAADDTKFVKRSLILRPIR